MTTRCRVTNRMKFDCAHCHPVNIEGDNLAWELAEDEDLDPGAKLPNKWFLSQYHGRCSRCNTHYRPNDLICRDHLNPRKYISQECCG